MSQYFELCNEIVQRVLLDTKNQPEADIQRALIKAFPYHVSNLLAWNEYHKEITRQSGRIMAPAGPGKADNKYEAQRRHR